MNRPLSQTTNYLKHFYYIRIHDLKDQLKVHFDFGKNITFRFNDGLVSSNDSNIGPVIYILDLKLMVDENNQIYVEHKSEYKCVDKYRLKLSYYNTMLSKTINHEERTDVYHSIGDFWNEEHIFLFDIHFQPFHSFNPPGEDTDYVTNLCLFIYFFLLYQKYDLFNPLAQQFPKLSFHKHDSENFFDKCLKYLHFTSETSIIIIRMFGLLMPIKKESFHPSSKAKEFIRKFMSYLRPMKIMNQSTEVTFKNGLALLFALELMFENVDSFVYQISDEKVRREVAEGMIEQLAEVDEPIQTNSNWIDLLTIINPMKIQLRYLNLTSSIETMVNCLKKLDKILPDRHQFDDELKNYFEERANPNHPRSTLPPISIDLKSILYLLNFLKQEFSSNHLLSTLQSIITTSYALKQTIKLYFDQLKMTSENMLQIASIFYSISKFSILDYLDPYEYLQKSLEQIHSSEQSIKWFEYFLVNQQGRDELEPSKCKLLVQHWIDYLKKKPSNFMEILKVLDRFLNTTNDNDWFWSFFIDRMIESCFEQDIYSMIIDGLANIRNTGFRIRFIKKFNELASNNSKHALTKLVELDKQVSGRSLLVRDLIQVLSEQIEISNDELLHDVFDQPGKSTLIYRILFKEPFVNFSIHTKMIERLMNIWIEWEKDGFQIDEIQAWNELNAEQQQIASEIWKLIQENLRKSKRFEELLDEANRKLREIIEIKEKVTLCLNSYCQHASDKEIYFDQIKNLQHQLEQKKINSIEIPEDLKNIIQFANRLNSISTSQIWQRFLNENNSIIKNDLNINTLRLLEEIDAIFTRFNSYINNLLSDRIQPVLPQLQQLFPEQSLIDYEYEQIKALLHSSIVDDVDLLVRYWKNRWTIRQLCYGCIDICKRYHIRSTDKLLLVEKLLMINEQTSSEMCLSLYQNYCRCYVKVHSDIALKFLSEYGRSKDLFDFLHSLTPSDVDSLLEVVNDWDETLINTKTVLDFVSLKSFFDQMETSIEQIRAKQVLEFDDILHTFEMISKQKEFKFILNTIQSCSLFLPSIRQIHTASMDKEQSKRRRILDMMKESRIEFIQKSNNFDVRVTDYQNKETYFHELNELRDRARLIDYANRNNNKIQNYTESDLEQLRSIILFVETLELILKTLTGLYRAGYPLIEKLLSPNRIFECKQGDGNYKDLDRFRCDQNVVLTEWEDNLCDMYKICTDLTYFSDQQVWKIEEILYTATPILRNDPGYHLLKFIGIDSQTIQIETLPTLSEDPRQRLINIANILNQLHPREEAISRQDDKQIFLIQTPYEGILRCIFSLFHRYQSSIHANRLFFCTRKTNWIEIRAFIYRCFYSQTFHQLIRPELLPLVIRDKFVELFNQLISDSPNHHLQLGIITTEPSTSLHLINGLTKHQIVQIIDDQDLLTESNLEKSIQGHIGNQCMLVTSRIAGLGKSTYIERQARELQKTRINFSINGNVNIDTLIERLWSKNIQLAASEIILHINIGPVENIQQLNEFLYSLILFRCFRLGHRPVDVPANIPIYIELDSSSFILPLYDGITIFKYLKIKHIDQLDWNELRSNSSIVQFVANYLWAIRDRSIIGISITEETKRPITKSICIKLLQEQFLPNKNSDFISWTKLSIFLLVYYKLFSGFSKCGYFMIDPQNLSVLRLDVLKALLNSSHQFTSLCVETVRKNQSAVQNNEDANPFSEAIIRWDQTQPFTVIFTVTDNPLFIYKTPANVPMSLKQALLNYFQVMNKGAANRNRPPGLFSSIFNKRPAATGVITPIKDPQQQLEEFLCDPNQMTHEQFFLQLTSLSTKYITRKSICGKCFSQYAYHEKDCLSCPTDEPLLRPASLNSEDIEDFQKKIATILHSQYVFTADNYIKMLLIYLRVQSHLPVLIMGETGCGKTALIQCLCQRILDDEMVVFHIHAGITNEKIIETMHDYLSQAQKCSEKNKRLWIFFDEFNTTSSIGLLKEIICERRLVGEPLPQNMVFLGACNPQRRSEKKKQTSEIEGTRKYRSDQQRRLQGIDPTLLYSVVPIPETMLEHVWDYGFLDPPTEKTYIKTILSSCEDLTKNKTWFACIVASISASQTFLRERKDVSCVSLRDVARFCCFYRWFYTRAISPEDEPVFNPIQRASLLSLFLCYYFRFDSTVTRENYLITLSNEIGRYERNISFESIKALLNHEKMALVDRMELPLGTAKNRALTDNIFVLFTCILNRIPVIITGRPGSSKTLAVQILISNLKGKKSKDLLFRTQAELIAISYQGSQSCTSESIIKVFQQAEKCIQLMSTNEILPVIVFDEIGLAELSPNNPLKVLHNELELESCRYGFVGLSNRRLDASKMNRAVYLSCPKANEDDLVKTAEALSKSMLRDGLQAVPLDSSIIESLAKAYLELCEHMKKQTKEYYFGLRDYYALIKGIIHDRSDNDLDKVIQHNLSCNFGGIIESAKFMWSKFCENNHQNHKINDYSSPRFVDLLNQCLSTRSGRFLMLIGQTDSDFDYVQRYITNKHPSVQTRTLIGSTLAGDFLSNTTYTEEYNIRVLMDIILYAEKNVTLFFRGLNHLYDNLYDLFNQNFAVAARKKYCRIALGSLYHPRCIIHDEFYCVVFVKQEELVHYDPPFLNRFEKHLIDIKDLLRQGDYETVLDHINQSINESFTDSKELFIWSNEFYRLNLVTEVLEQLPRSCKSDDHQDVLTYFQHEIICTSSFDLPLLLSLKSKQDSHQFIEEYYNTHNDLSFPSFINQVFTHENNPRLLIYTYTQIYETINYDGIINHELWIEEVKLSHFKTELELIQTLRAHFQLEDTRLICIRVDYHQDHQHIPMLKHVLLNEFVLYELRGVCSIFHLQRSQMNQIQNDVYFDGWTRVMIDDLQQHQIIPQDILMNPSYGNLITFLDSLNWEELIHQVFTKFRYTTVNRMYETRINDRRSQIVEHLTRKSIDDNRSLGISVKNHLLRIIQTNTSDLADWRQDLLSDTVITHTCRSINDALNRIVSNFLRKYLSFLLSYYETYSLIDSYLFLIHSEDLIGSKLWPIWLHCQRQIDRKLDLSLLNENLIDIPVISDLHLPCVTIEYEIICQIRQFIIQTYAGKDEDALEFAYKELINKSIYGEYIKDILNDPNLFKHYFHDQLTLARNEANIHQLSISFIERLLTMNKLDTIKDQLSYLLIYHEEFFEILRFFEIAVGLMGEEEEETMLDILTADKNNLYRLVFEESDIFLIPPGFSDIDEDPFECLANPFIEVSLMNLVELITTPTSIDRLHSMQELLTNYALIMQSMIILTRFGHYVINNLEKLTSFYRLASCISTIFPDEKAFPIFKQIYHHEDFSITFTSLDHIHQTITFVTQTVRAQKPTVSEKTIYQTLLKLESELLRNWAIDHLEQCIEILEFLRTYSLWNYSAKIIALIEKYFKISSKTKEYNGQISEIDEYININQYLYQLKGSRRKFEILLAMRIYMQLTYDIDIKNKQKLIEFLRSQFNYFRQNIQTIETPKEINLECISLIAWLRYYLFYYIYALKNDINDGIMTKIDQLFHDNTSKFASTVKLYIIKQLCQCENLSYYDLSKKYTLRTVNWMLVMIKTPSFHQRLFNAREDVILPTPLFQSYDEFQRINKILSTSPMTLNEWKELIIQCSTDQTTAYCFLMWFVHYYTRFYTSTVIPDDRLVQMIRQSLRKELIDCFESIGHCLIDSLCTNFSEKSYFHLSPSMPEKDLHQRLLILTIMALLISLRSLKHPSLPASLLFDIKLQMPKSYTEHFQKLSYLPGVSIANNPVLIQMSTIRDEMQNQSDLQVNIFRCPSSDCHWLFTKEQNSCPRCGQKTTISMNKDATLELITPYLEQTNQSTYHTQPPTAHFISVIIHAVFLFLYELKLLPSSASSTRPYLCEQIETTCLFLEKHFSKSEQGYLWLYKILNRLSIKKFVEEDYLDKESKFEQLEKLLEQKLIVPHSQSMINEIKEYQLAYAYFVFEEKKQNYLINFVNETVENNEEYPFLQFFNVTNIHSFNVVDHFYNKLQLQMNYQSNYPLTTFILKRLLDFDTIPKLHPVVRLINYLMQQYDYRIKRNDDKKKTIGDCLKDDASLTEIFDDFRHAWSNEFTNETNLSMFLLNKSNENETMKITNCLNRLVNLQNEIIDYFYLNILNYVGEHRVVPMQSIQKRHLFDFDTNKLRQVLWEKGLLINDEYGMSEEIIYDFDEIEWILRNEVSCLPKIDVKNMRYFHYQGDLYDETMSLINDIRSQLEQKLFDPSERKEIKQVIENLDKNLLLELFDLMEYILFYLRNLNNQTILQTFTLQTFIQQYVHLKAINENKLLNKKPLSSIHLNYIIDFYELIEQCLFDKILSHNIRTEFNEDSFSDQQRNEILDQFCRQTIDNEQTVNCFKDLNNWIDMFKRLLVRVLLPKKNINFDSPLHDYVKWTDMWKGNISPENIRTIEINRNICLKHSFIILKGLELKNLPQVTSDDESMPQSTKPSQRSKNVSQRGGRAIPKTVLRD